MSTFSAKLRYAKLVVKGNLVRTSFLDIEEVDWFAAPFEVMDKLVRWVTLLQDEGVMEKLAKLFNHIDILVISNTAGEFAQLTHLKNEVFLDLIKLSTDKFESVKVPLLSIVL